MEKNFTEFLYGKRLSLRITSFFLFFICFAATHGYMSPLADQLFNRVKFEKNVFLVKHTGEFKNKKDAPASKGKIVNHRANKNPKADRSGAESFTRPAISAPFAGTLAGPGGPILVIHAASNPFSLYTTEILLAEGLNEFASSDISGVTAGMLSGYDIAIVGDIPLTDAQVTMLSDWTNAGGVLIAFSPDTKLTPLLGLTPAGGILANKYLLVETRTVPGRGIVDETMQYQCEADKYILNGATTVATLYEDANTPTSYPAVTMHSVGTLGGKAIAFTFDLARSIVYTRQGNPAWAGQKRDGTAGPIRSDDHYFPDWLNLEKIAIPVADEQQRLLANIILHNARKPLPRFWYLPRELKAAVVMTGDDHGRGGTKARFNQYLRESADNSAEAVADWRAIRGSSYIFIGTDITDAQARDFEQQGFEIGLHVNTACANFTQSSLERDYAIQLADFAVNYPSLAAPTTNRTHCIAWSDWHTQASVAAPKGIRLDCNYYTYPGPWVLDRPGMFTGSGMPMRFADLNGSIIDCYQLATQMTDESDQSYPLTIDRLLDRALGVEGYYGIFCANMHTDADESGGSDAIIASAKARSVPVISAKQALTWLDGRNGSSFGAMSWNANELNFTISAASGARSLQAMLPITEKTGQLVSLTANGSPVTPRMEHIKGIDYAFFPATTGNYVATYNPLIPPNKGPTVAITSPAPGASFTEPASVAITATASDPDGTVVKVEFFQGNTKLSEALTSPYTFTWTNVPAGTYSLTARATDNAGVVTISDPVSVSVNATCPCSVFKDTDVPAGALHNDGQALEVGMKFRSTVAGNVTGVRFYKQTGNNGTHIGQLYNSTGTLLEQATFENETSSGWQQVNFSSPVSVMPNTTYVIAYHSSSGTYSGSKAYFNTTADRTPLQGLANGQDGSNGVFQYSSTPAFPTNTFGASNYWVDVVFVPGTPTDNQPPTVAITSPINEATFNPPASIVIGAAAADAEGTVAQVEFFQGSTKLGEDLTSPYSFSWNDVPAGTYSLTAIATDNAGAVTTSAAVNITVKAATNQPPTVAITSPADGNTFTAPASIVITAAAADAEGTVAQVEFFQGSTKLGEDLTSPYSFAWNDVPAGTYSFTAIATDNAGAVATSTPVSVTVSGSPTSDCPCTVFKDTDAPAGALLNDGRAVELGMKFLSSTDGFIKGVRFYKQSGNEGTHIGQLYSNTGTLLAQARFVDETESGWQQVNFLNPVAITAYTTYVIAYHSGNGFYSESNSYFTEPIIKGPLEGLASVDGVRNGIYLYTDSPAFPINNYEPSNYWVDAVFTTNFEPVENRPPTVAITSPADRATFATPASFAITAAAADAEGTVAQVEFFQGSTKLGEDLTSPYSFAWNDVPAGTYSFTAKATDNAGAVATSTPVSVTVSGSPTSDCPCTVFKDTDTPAGALLNDGERPVQLGMKFRSSIDGFATGVRFYKQSGNEGTHIGQLYSNTGTLLAEATFINETASGWQQVNFSSSVPITANTTYVISYHSSSGRYSTFDYGFDLPIVNKVLTGLQNGADGPNGVYLYTNSPAFPTANYLSSNYYVDVVFNTSPTDGSPGARLAMAIPEAGQPSSFLQEGEMEVYPNPVTEKATVRFVLNQGGPYTLGLYDVQGRLVKLLNQGQAKAGLPIAVEVEGAKLVGGLYLLRLQTSKGGRTAKLLRLR